MPDKRHKAMYPSFSVRVYDIECTNLNADWGIMTAAGFMDLTPEWTANNEDVLKRWSRTICEQLVGDDPTPIPKKLLDECNITIHRLDDYDLFPKDNTNDGALVGDTFAEIANSNILVGFYSQYFDLKFLRARGAFHGLEFPAQFYHGDIYPAIKRLYALRRRGLINAAEMFGYGLKTPLRTQDMVDAFNVGPKGKIARDFISLHLAYDLLTTAALYSKVWSSVELKLTRE